MAQYDLSRTTLAKVLNTPVTTVHGWFDDGKQPPGCLTVLLDLIERRTQVCKDIGLCAPAPIGAPRGRPFKRGNPYRFKRQPRR